MVVVGSVDTGSGVTGFPVAYLGSVTFLMLSVPWRGTEFEI